ASADLARSCRATGARRPDAAPVRPTAALRRPVACRARRNMSIPVDPAAINPETAYEPSDWRISAVAIVLAMVLGLIAMAVLVLRIVFQTAASDVDRSPTVTMPTPALQTDPARDLALFRAREDRALNTYYWAD